MNSVGCNHSRWPRLGVIALLMTSQLTWMAPGGVGRAAGAGPSCRFGITVPLGVTGYEAELDESGACAYLDWGYHQTPYQPSGVEYVQMLRVRDDLYPIDSTTLSNLVTSNPGAAWLIGNEPDTCYENQDCVTPETYAARFFDLASQIRALDSTARIGFGSLVQPTTLRLRYLERAWTALISLAGSQSAAEGLIDFWNVHAFILNEWPGEWGTGVPPGFTCDTTQGVCWDEGTTPDCSATPNLCWPIVHYTDYPYSETHDNSIFDARIQDLRAWMADHGVRDFPLWVTEYGSLFPPVDPPGGPDLVNVSDSETARFMVDSFNFIRTETDPNTGYAADGNRLVQRAFWYSLNDHRYTFGGSLYDPDNGGQRTAVGDAWLYDQWAQEPVQAAVGGTYIPSAFSPGDGRSYWGRVTLTPQGPTGQAFRLVIWFQIPVDWGVGWARQASATYGNAGLTTSAASLSWMEQAGNCAFGGPAESGYKWLGWQGPIETLADQATRLDDIIAIHGGIRVSASETPGDYSGVRLVLGLMSDTTGDGTPDTYSCSGGAGGVVAVQ